MLGKVGVLVVGVGAVVALPAVRDAHACGGCFHPPTQSGTVVTDHRMIFSVSPQLTTLYDEIEYQGSPSSFAWVLPIHAPVRVGLSSDILFAALEQITKTTIVAPPSPCTGMRAPVSGSPPTPNVVAASGGGGGQVTVLSQQVVGPYDTVQLQSTDPNALNAWLTANGFSIPQDIQSVIAAYVREGFDFLAMRLAPGQGVQAMRPVSVTSAGAALSLPLRMVAAGTGATVGITLWVVSTGRYEPENFPTFNISPSELVWDWSTNDSNYAAVRTQKETSLSDQAWQMESSLDLSPNQIEDLIIFRTATPDYVAIPSSDAGPGETADQVRQIDLATLFPMGGSTVRITRMRADLSRAALANDLVLQASADQSPLDNFYQVMQSINAPTCPASASSGGGPSSSGPGQLLDIPDGSTAGSGTGALGNTNPPGAGNASNGGTAVHATPGSRSGGCATSPSSQYAGTGLGSALVGLIGASLIRTHQRKLRSRPHAHAKRDSG